jgi:zinc/manganese transport system substrate-binding protein
VTRRTAVWGAAVLALAGCAGAPAGTPPTDDAVAPATTVAPADVPAARVVVTYSVLGALVRDLVGDAADVVVVVPDGTDPHAYEPSAKDVEAITTADVVVANGLGLEEGLEDVLDAAEEAGTVVFHVADHVTVREMGHDDGHDHGSDDGHDHGSDDEHDHAAGDPHLWLSPATLAEAVPAMGDAIGAAIGADLSGAVAEVVEDLADLDARIAALVGALDACELVTGHDELGYFADRYGCEVVGTIIPSLGTTAEATAADLAELREVAAERRTAAIFTGLGTPPEVAARVAADVGVPLVELRTHAIGPAGTYESLLLDLARTIVDALDGA